MHSGSRCESSDQSMFELILDRGIIPGPSVVKGWWKDATPTGLLVGSSMGTLLFARRTITSGNHNVVDGGETAAQVGDY